MGVADGRGFMAGLRALFRKGGSNRPPAVADPPVTPDKPDPPVTPDKPDPPLGSLTSEEHRALLDAIEKGEALERGGENVGSSATGESTSVDTWATEVEAFLRKHINAAPADHFAREVHKGKGGQDQARLGVKELQRIRGVVDAGGFE